MKHILSPEGHAAIDALMAGRPLLAFDFDGTLAPIVARPEDARVSPGLCDHLGLLSAVLPTAIVTGRSVADVRHRLGFEPHSIIGSHGAETPLGTQHPATRTDWQATLAPARQLLQAQQARLAATGIHLEDKSQSLALHHRLAPDQGLAQQLIDDLVRRLPPGLRTFGGKCVLNIVAEDAPDKGDAVNALARHLGCSQGLFIGDDVNDEPAFQKAPDGWLTVRIGPEDTPCSARFFLDNHDEMVALLQAAVDALRRHHPHLRQPSAPPRADRGRG